MMCHLHNITGQVFTEMDQVILGLGFDIAGKEEAPTLNVDAQDKGIIIVLRRP
jgi:hypothetical protein